MNKLIILLISFTFISLSRSKKNSCNAPGLVYKNNKCSRCPKNQYIEQHTTNKCKNCNDHSHRPNRLHKKCLNVCATSPETSGAVCVAMINKFCTNIISGELCNSFCFGNIKMIGTAPKCHNGNWSGIASCACYPGEEIYRNRCRKCNIKSYSQYGIQCTPCTGEMLPKKDNTGCILCNPGEEIFDSKCISCNRTSYSLDGIKCVPCLKDQYSVNSHTTCIECKPGHEIKQNKCITCNNTSYSTDGYQCLSCEKGSISNIDKTFCFKPPKATLLFVYISFVIIFLTLLVLILFSIYSWYKGRSPKGLRNVDIGEEEELNFENNVYVIDTEMVVNKENA